MEQASDPKVLAAAKLAARDLRLATIRRRATVFAASVLCACCLVIGGQFAAGRDPALAKKTAQAQAKATKPQAEATKAQADETGTESESEAESESTDAGGDLGAAPATAAATPEPTPVTTSQS